MPDPLRPAALVLGRPDNPLLPQVVEALDHQGLRGVVCHQAAQAFIQLARRDAPDRAFVVSLVLDELPGMTVAALAKSLRGLPGRDSLPLILVDEQIIAPIRALAVRPPAAAADLAHWAATPPEGWPTDGKPSPTVAPTARTGATPAATSQDTGIILVVDDHAINRTMMCLQAKAAGLPIASCEDGAAAVARVAAGGVRLVLMDCQMPDMDGYEATRAIRQAEAGTGRHLPIIAVTAHAMAENRQRCLDAGMDDFLAKPLTQEQLLATIRQWLQDQPARAPTTAGDPVASVIFDPTPLRTIDRSSPGAGRQLADILLGDLPRAHASFQQLLADGALEALGRAAHKLKGTSGSLGAMELYQTCSDLEQAARRQDDPACHRAVAAALLAIARVQPLLTACAASLTKG